VDEMILDVIPSIEMINNKPLKEAGYKYKVEAEKIRKQIMEIGKTKEKISLYDDDDENSNVEELENEINTNKKIDKK
jgi:hypothetical protein